MIRGLARIGNTVPRTVRHASNAAAASSGQEMVLNFCTPHAAVYNKKVVDQVILPGMKGDYGITQGHSPLISQLEPGVVTVIHVGGATEKYFIPGGFAITQANSVTDVSVPDAVLLSDLDESAIRACFAAASQQLASSAEGSVAKAEAMVQMSTASAMGRALGITLN